MRFCELLGWCGSLALHAAILWFSWALSEEEQEPPASTLTVALTVPPAESEPLEEPEPAAELDPLELKPPVDEAPDEELVADDVWQTPAAPEPEPAPPEPDPEPEPPAPEPVAKTEPEPEPAEPEPEPKVSEPVAAAAETNEPPELPSPTEVPEPMVPAEVASELDRALKEVLEHIDEPSRERPVETEPLPPAPRAVSARKWSDDAIRALDLVIDPSNHERFVTACQSLGIRFLVVGPGAQPKWVLDVNGENLDQVSQMQREDLARLSRRAHDLTPDSRFRAVRDRAARRFDKSPIGARIFAAVPAGADRMFLAAERAFLEAAGEKGARYTTLYARFVPNGSDWELEILRGR